MPKLAKGLTDNTIKNAKTTGKEYVLSDGDGLQLRIRTNGTKTWLFRYRHPLSNKICKMTLGAYPALSLKNARQLAIRYNEQIAIGQDPKEVKDQEKREHLAKYENTLICVASMWFELKKTKVSEDYAQDIWRSLVLHVFSKLGNIPIQQINSPDTISVLKPLATDNKLETLRRICFRLNEIMDYALSYGFIVSNPLSKIKNVFPKPSRKHYATIKAEQLQKFMHKLALGNMTLTTRNLIKFQLHTLTRPSEASQARWAHIDFEKRVWTIPAEEKKNYKKDLCRGQFRGKLQNSKLGMNELAVTSRL